MKKNRSCRPPLPPKALINEFSNHSEREREREREIRVELIYNCNKIK